MRIRKNIKQLENVIRGMVSEAKADDVRQEIEAAYNQIKVVKEKLKGLGNTNKKNQKFKNAMRGMVDELEDLEDLDMEEEVSEEDEELVRKNEQSEGHGTWQGLGMKENVVKLRESDMNYIFKQVLNESYSCHRNDSGQNGECDNGGNYSHYTTVNAGQCRGSGGTGSKPSACEGGVGPGDIMGGFLELPDFEEDWGGKVISCNGAGEVMGRNGCECINPKLGCSEEEEFDGGMFGCGYRTCYDGTWDSKECRCITDAERWEREW